MAIHLNNVPLFTPVCSDEFPWLKLSAQYLSPLTGNLTEAVHNTGNPIVEGNFGCSEKPYETSMVSTAIKVATYFISSGILPLLALIVLCVSRMMYQFHFMDNRYLDYKLPENIRTVPNKEGVRAAIELLAEGWSEVDLTQLRNLEAAAGDVYRNQEPFSSFPVLPEIKKEEIETLMKVREIGKEKNIKKKWSF